MTRFALPLCLLLALPATAQEEGDVDEGLGLMQEGGRMLLRGLIDELGPALEEMEGMSQEMRAAIQALASDMGPALRETIRLIDEIGYYEGPEVLPNGDIVIRRKEDAPPYERPEDAPAPPPEEIEL